ncbi:hypothetical protein CVT26_005434 [Gymnopilus dilepis]|uniref:Uncharacterized protein n=1 Tax=Gymnopilus dilepis TaxID=231916 RepID=A0A409W8K2_9AGAR|nr:hypothetical protein CVT26_005434 [Gymnopilus dilepis]
MAPHIATLSGQGLSDVVTGYIASIGIYDLSAIWTVRAFIAFCKFQGGIWMLGWTHSPHAALCGSVIGLEVACYRAQQDAVCAIPHTETWKQWPEEQPLVTSNTDNHHRHESGGALHTEFAARQRIGVQSPFGAPRLRRSFPVLVTVSVPPFIRMIFLHARSFVSSTPSSLLPAVQPPDQPLATSRFKAVIKCLQQTARVMP